MSTYARSDNAYDLPEVADLYTREAASGGREASLLLEGVSCAGCAWRIEQALQSLEGVHEAQVNFAAHRAQVRWDRNICSLADVLDAVAQAGYQARPYDPQAREGVFLTQRRAYLRRLGLAGLLGMQVMMAAIGLYAGQWYGMDARFETLLRWLSLVLTVPVLLYAGRPFLQGAWQCLRQRRANMDLPIGLGLSIAFGASVWATLDGGGEVYFDSVVMFVFLVQLARFFEFEARRRASERTEYLLTPVPETAERLHSDGRGRVVPAASLVAGDRVRVRPGETVPADGRVIRGTSSVDESLLTGESRPVAKHPGEWVLGGSTNFESPIEVVVEHAGEDTAVSRLRERANRAQFERPWISELSARIAGPFVIVVLLLAAGAGLFWWLTDPELWLSTTIAVLVITCPCALSLATPTALTAAQSAMARRGLLVLRPGTVEKLAEADHAMFDKTGTLTRGDYRLLGIESEGETNPEVYRRIAAALEAHSEHPVARALTRDGPAVEPATEVSNTPGGGLSGVVDGRRWWIGSLAFVAQGSSENVPLGDDYWPTDGSSDELLPVSRIFLADTARIHCTFLLGDEVRPSARETITDLASSGVVPTILSGDGAQPVAMLGEAFALAHYGELGPQDKLDHIRAAQAAGHRVLMVGDGVNDAPVLAGADVSIAMGEGAQIALSNADAILLDTRLSTVADAVHLARRARRIMGQNLTWAIAYNLIAVPAAMAGLVAPWVAAVGMSASSLGVVLNSLRLGRDSPSGKPSADTSQADEHPRVGPGDDLVTAPRLIESPNPSVSGRTQA